MQRLYLSPHTALKQLETPCVYDILTDELYELDGEAFRLLEATSSPDGALLDPSSGFARFCIDAGILTETPQDIRRPLISASPLPSLRYLELQITRRCNLSCAHCLIGPAVKTDLPVDDIRLVLEEFERMQGLRVLITGGEPMLHPGFDEINRMLKDFSLRKVLFTNGMAVTGSMLSSLNVHEIQISIDGLEQGHDTLRGKGSFRRAIAAIEAARSAGMPFSVSTMVHTANLHEFDDMEQLFKRLGAREWNIDIPSPSGNMKAFNLPPKTAGPYLRYGFGEAYHGGGEGFACGHHLMSVGADGKCAKCSFYFDSPLGDISKGLLACWGRMEHIPLEALKCDCEMLDECRGGCRYRAHMAGSAAGKDFYKCGFHGIL